MRLLLLHPPLLSPVVWDRLAPLLRAAGHVVAAPRLLDGPPDDVATWWRDATRAAVGALPDADAVIAHSGAGVLAPSVLDALPAPVAVVLVDAVLPAPSGRHRTPPDLRAAVAGLAQDGVLPPWTRWWGDAVLTEQVPDPADRAALDREAPALPEAFYDVTVPLPPGWEPARRGYLRLSPAYQDDERRAADRGWRTTRLDATHLALLTDPGPVAHAVAGLLD